MLAIGGGMLMPRDAIPLHVQYATELSGQRRPRLCVLNQAVGDDPNTCLRFYDRLAGAPVELRHLALFPMPNVSDPEDLLMSQDIIFVGGGSVANMLAVWRAHGLDGVLRDAWAACTVLGGISAGAMCWFEASLTDSFGPDLRPLANGLGLVGGSFCPHFDREPRRNGCREWVRPAPNARLNFSMRRLTTFSRSGAAATCLARSGASWYGRRVYERTP